jgi:hypothetical protein
VAEQKELPYTIAMISSVMLISRMNTEAINNKKRGRIVLVRSRLDMCCLFVEFATLYLNSKMLATMQKRFHATEMQYFRDRRAGALSGFHIMVPIFFCG